MFSKKLFPKILVLGFSLFVSYAANAELTQVSVLITESSNDCGNNKYFDDPNPDSVLNGFSNCRISVDNGGELAYLSDVIIKFGGNDADFDGSHEISSNYTGVVQADDFDLTANASNTSGSWIYNNNEFTYPDIRFWTVKAGNDFVLFWQVDLTETPDNCLTGTDDFNLSFACMNLAQSVTTGSWATPVNGGGQIAGLSHITFFGGLCSEDDLNFDSSCGTTPTTTTGIPEPTSIALFSLALFGIVARRKNFTS
ncbi:MAG: PEP-CTERM sorting domain-containing protein [Colwellia sp.]|nr:PEP-CTERM sorting domain-containing protein [Colwellia sp.]